MLNGFESTLRDLENEVCSLYLEDDVPWIIGYSGGKDSTAVLQLIWSAIQSLDPKQWHKPVHVISTDTLVENPVVASWVAKSLDKMQRAAIDKSFPFEAHRLTPAIQDSFWVNLIGKGYPAPRHKFRWCTERLKIRPSNRFIQRCLGENGSVVLALGTRFHESAARNKTMKKRKGREVRSKCSPSLSLLSCIIYTPIENWTNDDVWFYLMQRSNPWGYNNRDLLGMYAGASADGECPLVVDDSTPSCGSSRFGCWVCTLVEKDKSMTAMVQNDAELEWMQPLLELRNLIDFREDGFAKNKATGEISQAHAKREAFASPVGEALAHYLVKKSGRPLDEVVRDPNWERLLRDYRRLNTGKVQIMESTGREIPGPYVQEARECWLRALLTAQAAVRELGPPDVAGLELITLEELEEIRRIWVVDKHELEDRVPVIYREILGIPYPGASLDDNLVLGQDEMAELAALCEGDELHYELTRNLIGLTIQQRNQSRRSGVYQDIEDTMVRSFFESREEALAVARTRSVELVREASETACSETLLQPELDLKI